MAVLFFFILQAVTFAGVSVSPLQQTVVVKPGKKTNFSINLANNQRSSQTRPSPVKVEIIDFEVSDRGQLSFGQEYKHSRSAVDWISIDESQFVLVPGQSRQLKLTVTAPIDADGDYWAAAMISLGESQKDEKGVQVKLRTASGIFIHVARRNHSERGEILDVNITMPEFDSVPLKENASVSETYKFKEKQSLKIDAKLENEGLISILARGKAYVYTQEMKRVAAIPMYTSRRQVLPGDSRWFTGILPQPLPAGKYNLRTFFSSDSKFKRKFTKDIEFSVSPDIADTWSKNFANETISKLTFEPQQLNLKLNPGRLTSANLQIKNQGINTVAANCRIENSGNDWLELKTTDFTLAPNSQTSMSCIVKVPSDAKPGTYNWNVLVEMERSGLESSDVEQYKIPVSIVIDENSRVTKK